MLLSQHAMRFHGSAGYRQYECAALDEDEQPRLVRDLGPHRVVILRNPGFLTAGGTVREAFDRMYYVERACRAPIAAQTRRKSCRQAAGQTTAAPAPRPGSTGWGRTG